MMEKKDARVGLECLECPGLSLTQPRLRFLALLERQRPMHGGGIVTTANSLQMTQKLQLSFNENTSYGGFAFDRPLSW